MKQIIKDENHDHFFIEDDHLFESVKTARGNRAHKLMHIEEIPQNENIEIRPYEK